MYEKMGERTAFLLLWMLSAAVTVALVFMLHGCALFKSVKVKVCPTISGSDVGCVEVDAVRADQLVKSGEYERVEIGGVAPRE